MATGSSAAVAFDTGQSSPRLSPGSLTGSGSLPSFVAAVCSKVHGQSLFEQCRTSGSRDLSLLQWRRSLPRQIGTPIAGRLPDGCTCVARVHVSLGYPLTGSRRGRYLATI